MPRQFLRSALILGTGALLWHLTGGLAAAQYYPVPPPRVAPGAPVAGAPYGYGCYPYAGGYWNGAASVLDAYGNLGVDQEQARIMREQANQARLDTQVKITDVMAYERANKYWYSDKQVDIQSKQVQAAMNNPPVQEITSGRALNTLLNYFDRVMALGSKGPTVPISPEVVKSMNVTGGDNGGNAGLLGEINSLEWPTVTLGANQKKLDDMLKKATYDAMSARVPPTTISQLSKQTDVVQSEVKQKYYKSEVDGVDYVDGNRFLDRVRAAIQALKQPNITQMLSGQLGPRGNTVDEVVQSMTSKGLSFAAAQPAQQSAYIAMHRAFVNYGLGAGATDTGFRMRVGTSLYVPVKKPL